MKIHSNKENNINEESKNALLNFRQNQINSNIKLHKIFLGLIILFNIGLLSFIIFYKSKIAQIKKLSNSHTSNINTNDIQLKSLSNELGHKMANIAALGSYDQFRFSLIFERSEEFHAVKKLIYDYEIELGEKMPEYEYFYNVFIYQGIADNDNAYSFMDYIHFVDRIIILIQTEEGNIFGIYHKELIIPNDDNEFTSTNKNVMIFSFDTKNIYKFIGKKNSICFTKDKFLSLGDDELIIYDEYLTNGGYIEFPLKSFDFSNVNENVLTNENGKFKIRNIEVYSFYEDI